MIKGIIRNTITLILAAVVLTATSGFNVFKHSCHLEKTTEYSFIIPEFNCNGDHHHEGTVHSCCGLPEKDDAESCNADKCCSTDSFFVKLDITLDIQDYSKKTVIPEIDIPAGTEYETVLPSGELSHIIISNDLPPPLSGKALRIFLHQLNIPYFSV